MKILSKLTLKVSMVLFLLIASLFATDIQIKNIFEVISNIKIFDCLLIVSLFILNFYLVTARNYLSYKQFNVNVSYKAVKTSLLAGYLGGIVPVFGAVIVQSMNLKKLANISSTSSSFLYFYDKIIMTISGLIIGLGAAKFVFPEWIVFNSFVFGSTSSQASNTTFMELVVVLFFCLAVVYFTAITNKDRKLIIQYICWRNIYYVATEILLSIVTWMMSASCFVISIMSLSGKAIEINIMQLFCVSIVVSFVSSLPLSVNGWGIREFSAVTFFGMLYVPGELSLLSAMIIGTLSTIALAIVALISHVPSLRFGTKIESIAH